MSRRLAREAALRSLFQIEAGHALPEEALEYNVAELALSSLVAGYAEEVVQGTLEHQKEIDELISLHTVGWAFDRLPRTDRAILRMAVFELCYKRDEVPVAVVINEAVELAKLYGDDASGSFVNGILAAIAAAMDSGRATSSPVEQ